MNITFFLVLSATVFFFLSCNADIYIDLPHREEMDTPISSDTSVQEPAIEAHVKIELSMAPFFVKYLGDLLGVNGVAELVTFMGLETYLQSKKQLYDIVLETHDDVKKHTIVIDFDTDHMVSVLRELSIPYEFTETAGVRQVKMSASWSVVVEILSSLQFFEDSDMLSVFFLDESDIVRDDFAEYMAWSFSEYEEQDTVVDSIENSRFSFVWSREDDDTHTPPAIRIPLTSLIYEENNNIVFTF